MLTPAPVGGEWPALRADGFTPREAASSTHYIWGWLDPRPDMFLQVRESDTHCKGSSSLVPEAIVPMVLHSPVQYKQRSLNLLFGTVVALFTSSPGGIAAEHYHVSTATGQQRKPSVQERRIEHICLFRIITQWVFLFRWGRPTSSLQGCSV
jgi:hypothetical protein